MAELRCYMERNSAMETMVVAGTPFEAEGPCREPPPCREAELIENLTLG
jgi:hypothetical protein